LVEAALVFPGACQGHWDHRLDVRRQSRDALFHHELGEGPRQRAPAGELEGVEGFPKRPFVDRR